MSAMNLELPASNQEPSRLSCPSNRLWFVRGPFESERTHGFRKRLSSFHILSTSTFWTRRAMYLLVHISRRGIHRLFVRALAVPQRRLLSILAMGLSARARLKSPAFLLSKA